MARKNGNVESSGKSGKRPRSTKAPAIIGAVLEKRVHGASKAAIARDLKLSHNTVDKILEQTEIDARIAEGRSKALGLIPNAIEGAKLAMAKGDGSTSIRFLEGIGVLGDDKASRGNGMGTDAALNVAIRNLYLQHPAVHSALMSMPFNQAQPQSNSTAPITVEAQSVDKKTDTSS